MGMYCTYINTQADMDDSDDEEFVKPLEIPNKVLLENLGNSRVGLNLMVKEAMKFDCPTRDAPVNNSATRSSLTFLDIASGISSFGKKLNDSLVTTDQNVTYSEHSIPVFKTRSSNSKRKLDSGILPQSKIEKIALDSDVTRNRKLVSPITTPEPEKVKQAPTKASSPEHQLKQRQRQIDFGKNTDGYKLYISMIPKHKRTIEHPSTPDPRGKFSKRQWDGKVNAWRRGLHKYDPITVVVGTR